MRRKIFKEIKKELLHKRLEDIFSDGTDSLSREYITNVFCCPAEFVQYYLMIHSIEIQKALQGIESPIDSIYTIFDLTYRQAQLHKNLFMEIAKLKLSNTLDKNPIKLNRVERCGFVEKDLYGLMQPYLEKITANKDREAQLFLELSNFCFAIVSMDTLPYPPKDVIEPTLKAIIGPRGL